ncbi:hypothetical protein [Deinococcus sp. UYEF24]
MDPKLTGIQWYALGVVGQAGALTSRRVTEECGPRPNWYRLITDGYLNESHTMYGPVLSLTTRGHKVLAAADHWPLPYLMGPATVADRAYLNDAIQLMGDEAYTVERNEYKGAGGLRHQGRYTDQVTRTILRVPPRIEIQIRQRGGYVAAHKQEPDGSHKEQLGYPSLYASISSGGIGLARLKRLYRRHEFHIDEWQHPLIVAVPDGEKMRAFLRSLDAQARRLRGSQPARGYELVRLLYLPMPRR